MNNLKPTETVKCESAYEKLVNAELSILNYCNPGEMFWDDFKREWKEEYKRLSNEIKKAKRKVRVAYPVWSDTYELIKLKHKARHLLVKRHVMKAEIKAWGLHYGK